MLINYRIIWLGILAVFLSACAPSPINGGRALPRAPARTAHSEIVYLSSFDMEDPRARIIAQAIAEYEAISGNRVSITWLGPDSEAQIYERLRSGLIPDIWDGGLEHQMAANAEFMLELSEFYDIERTQWGGRSMRQAANPLLLELAQTSAEEGASAFAVPFAPYSIAFVYNIRHFENVGIAPPHTWEQLLEISRRLLENGYAPISVNMPPGVPYGYMLARAMGTAWVENLMHSPEMWAHPAVFKMAESFEELAQNGYLSRHEDRAYAGPYALQNERIAMRLMSTADIGGLISRVYYDEVPQFSAFNFPQINMGDMGRDPGQDAYAVMYGSHAFFIAAQSRHAAEAFEMISTALSPTFDEQLSLETLGIPFAADIAWPPAIRRLEQSFLRYEARMPIGGGAFANKNTMHNADYYFRLMLQGRIPARGFVDAMISTKP